MLAVAHGGRLQQVLQLLPEFRRHCGPMCPHLQISSSCHEACPTRPERSEAFGLFDDSGDPRIEGEPGTRESAGLGLCEIWLNEFGTRHGVLGAVFKTVPHKGPILAEQIKGQEKDAASRYSASNTAGQTPDKVL